MLPLKHSAILKPSLSDNLSGKQTFGPPVWPLKASILYYFSLYKFGRIFGKSSFPDQLKKDN